MRSTFPGHLHFPAPRPSRCFPKAGERCVFSRDPASASQSYWPAAGETTRPGHPLTFLYYTVPQPEHLQIVYCGPTPPDPRAHCQPLLGGKFGTRNSAHQHTSLPATQNRLQHPTSGRRSSFHHTIWGAVVFFSLEKTSVPRKKKFKLPSRANGKEARGGRSQRGGAGAGAGTAGDA